MMRLIDADAFDEVLQNAQTECKKKGGNFRYGVLSNVRANLAKMPTVGGWISVKDRLPESKKRVYVAVKTKSGVYAVLIASHINAREVNSEDYEWQDAELDWDYDEENDIYWVPECWYESNFVEDNTSWIVDEYADGVITHWMPLPKPPKEEDNAGS